MSDEEREDGAPDGEDSATADDPFSELDDVDDGSDPFSELDDAPLGERTPATDDDLFEEVEREELADEDAVVDSVLEGEGAPDAEAASGGTEVEGAVGADPAVEAETDTGGDGPARDEVVVPKRRYCEGCQYFTSPPETACEHPGTDILELVDADHFLVADCPVVEWRRELEAYPDPGEARNDPRE